MCQIGDNACVGKCAREYNENLQSCPCQQRCPLGCPCPNYQCSAVWILVLNTWIPSKKPLIIDGHGQSKEIGFAYGSNTETIGTCSVIWRGNMFLFGGYNHKKQISMVDQCQLKRVGDLPFIMYFGACAQRNDQQVYICFENYFDSSTGRNCHVSSGPLENFSSLPS